MLQVLQVPFTGGGHTYMLCISCVAAAGSKLRAVTPAVKSKDPPIKPSSLANQKSQPG